MAVQLVPNLVSPSDIEATLGRQLIDSDTIQESTQVSVWIDDAQIIVARRMGDLTLLDQNLLAYVIREAVAMKVKRPDPAQQTTISVDDASVSKRYEKDTGVITILPEWWDLLTPGTETPVGAFTIRPGGPRSFGGLL